MSLNNLVKRLQDIMRNDAGINGDAQRIEQIVWILFLKVYDIKEKEWALIYDKYQSIIPKELQWDKWACDKKDGKALTGDELLNFVNGKLFPSLKKIPIDENTPMNKAIIREACIRRNIRNDFKKSTKRGKCGRILHTESGYGFYS